jgi:hypothetical protein
MEYRMHKACENQYACGNGKPHAQNCQVEASFKPDDQRLGCDYDESVKQIKGHHRPVGFAVTLICD